MNGMKGITLHCKNWRAGSRASLIGVSLIAAGVFGMLYLGLPILFLPLGLGALLLALATIRSPALGVAFILATQYIPLQMAGFTLFQIAGASLAVLCLFWFAIHREGIVFPNVAFPMLIMIVISLYSLTFTKDSIRTEHMVLKLVMNLAFCLLLVNVIDGYRRLRWLLWGLVAMGAMNSVAAILQFARRSDSEFRATGFVGNENGLGLVASTACVICGYQFLYGKSRWIRIASMGLCILLAAGMVTAASRGATIAFGATLLYMLLREMRFRKQVLALGVLFLVGLFLVPENFSRRFTNIGDEVRDTIFFGERGQLGGRGYYNKAGVSIWKAHPLLGVGLGSYGYYFIQPEFNPGKTASTRLPAHNMYIQALAETGLFGFLVLCWWIFLAAYNYWKAEEKSGDDPEYRFYLGSCEAITLYALVAYFSSGNLVRTHMAILMALSSVGLRCAERSAPDPTDVGQGGEA